MGVGSEVEDARGKAWLLGPKNPFCRFTRDESIGCALCACPMERLLIREAGICLVSGARQT